MQLSLQGGSANDRMKDVLAVDTRRVGAILVFVEKAMEANKKRGGAGMAGVER